MTKLVFVILLLSIKATLAGDLKGCLAPAGKKMIIDKYCDCAATNSCVKFKPRKISENYYNSTDANGGRIYTNEERAKLKESYDIFYKIMDLKASGLSQSDEIKTLYVKLDKLNYDVRKSLFQNHASDYTEMKATYKKDLETRGKRNKKFSEKIRALISTNYKPFAMSTPKPESTAATKEATKEAPKTEPVSEMAQTNTPLSIEHTSGKTTEEINFMLKSIKPEKLNREESDSLFEIISKSYVRTAYPILLSP